MEPQCHFELPGNALVIEVRRRNQEEFSFHELVTLVVGKLKIIAVGELNIGLLHSCLHLNTVRKSVQSIPSSDAPASLWFPHPPQLATPIRRFMPRWPDRRHEPVAQCGRHILTPSRVALALPNADAYGPYRIPLVSAKGRIYKGACFRKILSESMPPAAKRKCA